MKRVGRCDAYATEFDLEAEEYVPLPKGDVHKKKSVVQVDSVFKSCVLSLTSSFGFKMQHCRRVQGTSHVDVVTNMWPHHLKIHREMCRRTASVMQAHTACGSTCNHEQQATTSRHKHPSATA